MKHKVTPVDTNATAFYDEGAVLSISPEVIDGVLPLIHPNVDLNMRYSCIIDGLSLTCSTYSLTHSLTNSGNALCFLFNVNNVTNTGTLALRNKYKRVKDILNELETDEDQKIVCDFYYNLYLHLREYCNDTDGVLGMCSALFCWQFVFVKRLQDKISGSFAPLSSILFKLQATKKFGANRPD